MLKHKTGAICQGYCGRHSYIGRGVELNTLEWPFQLKVLAILCALDQVTYPGDILNKGLSYVCVQLLSCVRLFAAPWTVTCQAPLSVEISRQEYWSGLPLPMPGHLPDPGIEPVSLVGYLGVILYAYPIMFCNNYFLTMK